MPKTVLIVDDHNDTRVICRELLTHFGYTVETATNGAEALEMTQRIKPDLIFLDFLMPDRNGLDILADLREQPATAKTPVVLYTAMAARVAEISAHPEVTRVLLKPLETSRLMQTVTELIGPSEVPA